MARRALAAAAAPPVSAPSLSSLRRRSRCGHLGNVVPCRGRREPGPSELVLQATTSLNVNQRPVSLWVKLGSQATLTCQVAHVQAWERLRVEWTKDGKVLCQSQVTNDSLSLDVCGPRGQLFWWVVSGELTLRLAQVSINDSGNYVCCATVEIPELLEDKGKGTELLVVEDGPPETPDSGFSGFLMLLVVGVLAVVLSALGAGYWRCRRNRYRESGNPLYSNVLLYQHRGTPKKTENSPGERNVLNPPKLGQKEESFYSASLPQLHGSPKACKIPRPSHPISKMKASPSQDAFEQSLTPRLREEVLVPENQDLASTSVPGDSRVAVILSKSQESVQTPRD
ncbi:PREDICTED: transmembrane and immunoglobulin domain-containing protein 2 [Chrysochloris asiatica]|uniref:transmembrane and immunoglobulin domain-containing protein 2 n=1 Tax=Chrysochloris asiatica TaxID=185453 RepID=UPI0003F113A3|nr:PREDICTED: transmembrane and immunoglobulin domain-containing protein 2 [Chrysochloris asiatica]